MKLALKIDVSTLRGLREGVPALIEILRRHDAGATFFFAVGPDHAGRFGPSLPPGAAGALHERRSVASRLYGTLLPGPDLGRRGGDVMRGVRDAGFETGLLGWDVARWRRHVVQAPAAWTEAAVQQGVDAYRRIFGEPPQAHAAAGWQTNVHALRMTQRLGFVYCSDGRGRFPHLPVGNAELIRCPQFPTTLPLLDECMAQGVDGESLVSHLLSLTAIPGADAPVFGLRADVEALAMPRVVEQLVIGWKAQGYALVPLAAVHADVEPLSLPRCEVALAPIAGRAHPVLQQGEEFLADVELPRAA
jgi:peptidoglycan/xylan/chitin deacetylase (PgdA/CDA1 family)